MKKHLPNKGTQRATNRKEVAILSRYLCERHHDCRWHAFVEGLVAQFEAPMFLSWFINFHPRVSDDQLVVECPRKDTATLIASYCSKELKELACMVGFQELKIITPQRMPL